MSVRLTGYGAQDPLMCLYLYQAPVFDTNFLLMCPCKAMGKTQTAGSLTPMWETKTEALILALIASASPTVNISGMSQQMEHLFHLIMHLFVYLVHLFIYVSTY